MNSKSAKQTKTVYAEGEESVLDAAIAATERNQTLTEKAAEWMGVPADSLLQILRGVWTTKKGEPELTQADMFVGIGIVAKYGLDPIAREIYVTKNKGKLMTIIGIDGWIKILDRTDHYDGHEVKIHQDENGKVDYVDAVIHSKLRKYPACYRAFQSEYSKVSGFVAGQLPSHMLRIFAIRHAARLFVPLGGTVMTEEEAGYIIEDDQPKSRTSRVSRVNIDDVAEDVEPTPEPTPDDPTTGDDPAAQFEAEVPAGTTPDMFAGQEGNTP